MALHRGEILDAGEVGLVAEDLKVTLRQRQVLRRPVTLKRSCQVAREDPVDAGIADEGVVDQLCILIAQCG